MFSNFALVTAGRGMIAEFIREIGELVPMAVQIAIMVIICLFLTIIIEYLFARILKVKGKDVSVVILAQVCTSPVIILVSNIFLVISNYDGWFYFGSLIVMEAFAVLVEGMMYKYFFRDYKILNPFLLSVILNLLSFFIGSAILIFL